MLNSTCHEAVGVRLEGAEAGAGAKVDALTAIQRAGVAVRLVDFSTTNGAGFQLIRWERLIHASSTSKAIHLLA